MNQSGGNIRRVIFKIKEVLFTWMRLKEGPHLRVYEGFGNDTHCSINGHALMLSPIPRLNYRHRFVYNSLALIRLFMVRPRPGARIKLYWDGEEYTTHSEKDGYFKFDWPLKGEKLPGDYTVMISLFHKTKDRVLYNVQGLVRIPEKSRYGFISDIDDTFLISHSETKLKRLYVLLTENAYSRRPFEGVVQHYRLLRLACTHADDPNPFFYVSSSEWNLYNYIKDFVRKNDLPQGIFLLNQMKTFSQILKTGQNNHSSKFMRIVRIMEAYPEKKFILLGDNSQKDPNIYNAITEHFPGRILAVYMRNIARLSKPEAEADMERIRARGIETCYFMHSEDAIAHSLQIGLQPQ